MRENDFSEMVWGAQVSNDVNELTRSKNWKTKGINLQDNKMQKMNLKIILHN